MIIKLLKLDSNWKNRVLQPGDTVDPTVLAPGGSDGDVLTKDSSLADGKKWAPASGSGSGDSISKIFVAGENLGGHRLVQSIGSQVFYFDASNISGYGKQLGMTSQSAVTGANINVILIGIVNNPGWGLITDSIYYASTNGLITTTIPTSNLDVRIGVAIDSNTLRLEISDQVIL